MGIKSKFTGNSFRAGSYSIFSTAAVIAIAVLAVLVIKALPASQTKFDLTEQQLYTLSEQTKQIVSGLEDDVNIYLLTQGGTENTVLEQLLEKYSATGTKLHVSKKDVVENPGFIRQYDSSMTTLHNNSLLVTCGDRYAFVGYDDMLTEDYDMYTGDYTYTFSGEDEITGAIDYVTSTNLPKVYMLSGHGETELSSSFTEAIKKQNIDAETINLTFEQRLPDDCDCLVIIGPTRDISSSELEIISEYLQNGGRLLLATSYVEESMENLFALTEKYGVYAEAGVIFEPTGEYSVNGRNWFLLPELNSHEITDPLIEHGYFALMSECHAIMEIQDFEYDENLSVVPILETSESAYLRKTFENTQKEEGDLTGKFTIGAAISKLLEDDEETRIVWFATPLLVYDEFDEAVAGANRDLFINSVAWLCEQESAISVHPKDISGGYITMTDSAASLLTTVMVAAIPLTFIACGIVVVVIRGRK